MAELLDPNGIVPVPPKPKIRPMTLVMLLLYPIVLGVGTAVGFVIGVAQGKKDTTTQQNQNVTPINTSVIPSANTNVGTNTINANTNVSNVFLNSNSALSGGDYLQLDAATTASLQQQQQRDEAQYVTTSGTVTDQLRQKDLIALKYNLKAYFTVKGSYPSTGGAQIKLDKTETDVFYSAMKTFYGGSFNHRIDPESPTYYYGYTSDGSTFTLTCYLVGPKQVFTLTQ